MPPKVPPQSDALYLLAVATMGESMVLMLSNRDTAATILRYLALLCEQIWAGGSASSLEALLAAPEYTAAAAMLRAGVVRPLDGVRRSAQEVRPGLYISGKGPPMQPTLCRHLGITHILRCFAKQEKTEPPTSSKTSSACLWASMGGAWSSSRGERILPAPIAVSYTHLRAHETPEHLVCRLLLEKKKNNNQQTIPHNKHTVTAQPTQIITY
eukprot:TRINITY_DN38056_c0_g1_i1.p1 TRINITY_DN38056_c0_g1~~TRINITY_DN38056_c0_g1_i1.p1  ORF type:complete len:212 (+),score=9.23 TRINITY_DN38056_c0_g1_i1:431-1066(+)